MSTLYNRRRGAKANRPRTPRKCAMPLGCDRLAYQKYCEGHKPDPRKAGH